MDTFKDKMEFDAMEARGDCPWALWKHDRVQERGPGQRARVAAVEAASSLHDAQA
jgi:hypothetical protein